MVVYKELRCDVLALFYLQKKIKKGELHELYDQKSYGYC